MSVKAACDIYYEWRRRHQEAKAAAADIAQRLWHAEQALIDAMLNEDMKTMKREDGTTVSLRRKFSCSVTQKNQDDIRDWLVERFGDDSEYVKEIVDKPALAAKLQSMLDEDEIEIDNLPEFLSASTRPAVSVRGWGNLEELEEAKEP